MGAAAFIRPGPLRRSHQLKNKAGRSPLDEALQGGHEEAAEAIVRSPKYDAEADAGPDVPPGATTTGAAPADADADEVDVEEIEVVEITDAGTAAAAAGADADDSSTGDGDAAAAQR